MKDVARATIRECIEKGIMADFLKSHHEEIISMCIEEFDAEKYAQSLFDEGREEGLMNMLRGMLISFKEERIPVESAYRFVSRNPECHSMSFEEIKNIWNDLP